MRKPTTTTQEVLYTAIEQGNVSLIDFPYLSGFRTRVSDLRKLGVEFKEETIEQVNKFGRKIRYQNHIIVDIERAKSVYYKLTRITKNTRK